MRKILVVIPFEGIYPPMNGGMLRCMNLLNQLAKHFEVTIIMKQEKQSFLRSLTEYPAIGNCTIISTREEPPVKDLFSILPAKLDSALRYRFWNRSVKGPANTEYLYVYPIVKRELQAKQFSCVIIEDMGILDIGKIVRRIQPSAAVIYNAYNVNTRLAELRTNRSPAARKNYEVIRQVESSLSGMVDTVFTCSDIDLDQLRKMNDAALGGVVVPNGVSMKHNRPDNSQLKDENLEDIIFCGSLDYSPNREGLSWFCREIFPILRSKKPGMRLLVVGKGDPGEELMTLLKQEGIVFYGKVDRVDVYYKKAILSVVPLLTGSGTRLKIFESMELGVPVVSTAVGAEGIDCTHGKDILMGDEPGSFADAVIKLLNDRTAALALAEAAYRLVKEKYDWNVIGNNMAAYINSIPNGKSKAI